MLAEETQWYSRAYACVRDDHTNETKRSDALCCAHMREERDIVR